MRSLSIIIPAYNEAKRLPDTLPVVQTFLNCRSFDFVEVIVVDDGSTDGTAAVVEKWRERDGRFTLLSNGVNRGKGFSVRNGMQHARGAWVLFSDADLSAPLDEVDKLWAAIESEKSDGAIGSRALDRSLVGVHQPLIREMSGRTFNLVMRVCSGLPYKDTQCGFKMFSLACARKVAALQTLDRFGFDVEVLYLARKFGYRIPEVPVRWNNVEGTKVSMLSGMTAFADPLRVRINDWMGRYRG